MKKLGGDRKEEGGKKLNDLRSKTRCSKKKGTATNASERCLLSIRRGGSTSEKLEGTCLLRGEKGKSYTRSRKIELRVIKGKK